MKDVVFRKAPLETIRQELITAGEFGEKTINRIIEGLSRSSVYYKNNRKD